MGVIKVNKNLQLNSNVIRILHLSDFHFKSNNQIEIFNQKIVTSSMIEKIKEINESNELIQLVLITGDLAFSGKKNEYKIAFRFLNKIKNTLKLDLKCFFIVPGNHDVLRSKAKVRELKKQTLFKQQDDVNSLLIDDEFKDTIYEKFQNFYSFLNEFKGRKIYNKDNFCVVEKISYNKSTINLLCLNSAIFCGYSGDENKKLALGLFQIQTVLDNIDNKSILNIALMHHHYSYFSDVELVNINKLLKISDLILLGHSHYPNNVYQLDSNGETHIISAGSCYEKRENYNSFNIIEVDLTNGKGFVEYYKYLPDKQEWIKNLDKYTDGKSPLQINRLIKEVKNIPTDFSFGSLKLRNSDTLTPIDIMGPTRSTITGRFNEFYYERDVDKELRSIIENILNDSLKKHILVMGPPLSGKSRLIYQTLKKLDNNFDLIIPESPNKLEINEIIKSINGNKKILILDDIHHYISIQNFEDIINRLLYIDDLIIIASCRTNKDFRIFEDRLLERHFDPENIFNVINVGKIEQDVAKKIAKKVQIDWNDTEFDGNIGSIFIKLSEMRRRYRDCSMKCRTVLRAIKYAYLTGISSYDRLFLKSNIEKICLSDKFKLDIQGHIGFELFNELKDLEFLNILEGKTIIVEEEYLKKIIDIDIKIDFADFDFLLSIFKNDPFSLFCMANKMINYEVSNKTQRIKLNEKIVCVLETAINRAQKHGNILEITVLKMKLALIYTNLGLMKNSSMDFKEAIKLYETLIEYYGESIKPNLFAIYNNCSVVYSNLANIEEPIINTKKAIELLDKSKKHLDEENLVINTILYNSNKIPLFSHLLQLTKRINTEEAFTAIKENEQLLSKHNLPFLEYSFLINKGNFYLILSDTQDYFENCYNALLNFERAKDIITENKFDDFTLASIKLQIGNAKSKIAENYKSILGCYDALDILLEALDYFKDKDDMYEYILANDYIGLTYNILAEISQIKKYYELAIDYHHKAIAKFNSINLSNIFLYINLYKAELGLARLLKDFILIEDSIQKFENLTKKKEFMDIILLKTNILFSIGLSYHDIAYLKNNATYYKKAIYYYELIKEYYDLRNNPRQFSLYYNNLGLAYFYLSLHEDTEANCEKAVSAYLQASKFLLIKNAELPIILQIITNYLQAHSFLLKIKFPAIRNNIKLYTPPVFIFENIEFFPI